MFETEQPSDSLSGCLDVPLQDSAGEVNQNFFSSLVKRLYCLLNHQVEGTFLFCSLRDLFLKKYFSITQTSGARLHGPPEHQAQSPAMPCRATPRARQVPVAPCLTAINHGTPLPAGQQQATRTTHAKKTRDTSCKRQVFACRKGKETGHARARFQLPGRFCARRMISAQLSSHHSPTGTLRPRPPIYGLASKPSNSPVQLPKAGASVQRIRGGRVSSRPSFPVFFFFF